MSALNGMAGNDVLNGGAGNDVLYGYDGDDRLYGHDGNDTLHGGFGGDVLDGHAGDDTLHGGADIDHLNGGAGSDQLYGGTGYDRFYIMDSTETERDIINDYENGDRLVIGENSTIKSSDDLTLTKVSDGYILASKDETDKFSVKIKTSIENLDIKNIQLTLSSGASDDVLNGGNSSDILNGGAGSDVLNGGNGHDWLYGQNGDDTLRGGTYNDTLNGDAGDDRLYGGADNDLLDGGAGIDHLYGGTGNDEFWISESTETSQDTIYDFKIGEMLVLGGNGAIKSRDDLKLRKVSDGYILESKDETDEFSVKIRTSVKNLELENIQLTLSGGAGDDVLNDDVGNDFLNGGAGNDVLNGGSDSNHLNGGEGDDTLNGGNGHDWLYGQNGDDTLRGGTYNDTLNGDAGDDRLYGGADNDLLNGGAGIDHLYGGTGNDEFWISESTETSQDTIYDFEIGERLVLGGNGAIKSRDDLTLRKVSDYYILESKDTTDEFSIKIITDNNNLKFNDINLVVQ